MYNKIIPIFIPHLGCPHDCVFCNQRAIAAPLIPSIEQVKCEIEQGLEYVTMPQIAFYGGSFTAIDKVLMESYLAVGYTFIKRGLVGGMRVSTRPDCIDADILKTLADYGVKTIELGAQSMKDKVLSLSGRGHTAEHTIAAADAVKRAGLQLGLQVMCGLPGGSREEAVNTAREIAMLSPDFVRIYPVCVIENTPLADMAVRGDYVPLTLEQGVSMAADMLEIFEENDIPVIRIGLNPTQELSKGGVVGGAYHPALGEMVRSQVLLRKIFTHLGDNCPEKVDICVQKGALSMLRGQKNCNVYALQEKYPKRVFTFSECVEQKEPLVIK